jgi:alcohol dehydrogenase class IV
MIASLSFPTQSHFGPGAVDRLRSELTRLKIRHALLITDVGLAATPTFERIRSLCAPSAVFDGVHSNPSEQNVMDAAEMFVTSECDGLVALGGGSVLDSAKAVRLKVNHPLPLSEYDSAYDGWKRITAEMPPVVAIPTTAGTGSEVSPCASITLERNNLKVVIRSPYLLPSAALIDPELTLSLPPAITAGSGLGAFATNVESYLATGYHPVCDALALDGTRLACTALPQVAGDPSSLDARSSMMMAAVMGGMAAEKGGGAAQALANALSGEFRLHNGAMRALMLPAVLDYSYPSVAERITELAARARVRDLIEAAAGLLAVTGVAARLRDHGVPQTALPMLARRAIQDPAHFHAPRACSEEDLLALYRQAW